MSTLDSILSILSKWPAWQRIVTTPDEVAALRKRVELLEASLRTRAAGEDECPRCHALGWRLVRTEADPTFGQLGVQRRVYACSSCSHSEFKQLK